LQKIEGKSDFFAKKSDFSHTKRTEIQYFIYICGT